MDRWNTADQVNVHKIPDVVLKFKPLAEIAAGRWCPDLLIHVIGYVHEVGYCQMQEGTSKKLQVNFMLKDGSDIALNCTLWEDCAAKFIKFSNERKEAGPIIVMLKYEKVKEEGKFPLSVTNTYGVTKLFINDNIAEINAFKENLPKQELLQSQSQLMCTQTFSGSQFNIEDEILANNLIMPLYEIIQLDQITYCVTVVRVEKVNSTSFGWYYLVCCKCPKVAKGEKPPYTCESGHNIETEIVRYKLELDVSYEGTKSTFVMWDREVSQLLGISAAQFRLNMIEAGITNRLEYPMLIVTL
ncbi:plant OB fold protein, putative [Medicago truncatula]|uniref:Plant OB fold protein, putative n=1 Tax=Medicago truncatula TaxID=3880 RepID=A0A072TZ63_MEDTR|nr:plant OB fold protein, putative [Medicago truncatula]